jgi:hypothetical protein
VFRLAAALSLTAPLTTPFLLHSDTGEARPSSADARFVSQNVPEVIPAGETRRVSLTFFNNGEATWDPEYGYSLGNIGDDLAWRVARVNIGAPVPPGNSETFSFDITAPVIPGNYRFQWSLARDGDSGNRGARLFGESSPNVFVAIVIPEHDADGTAASVSASGKAPVSHPALRSFAALGHSAAAPAATASTPVPSSVSGNWKRNEHFSTTFAESRELLRGGDRAGARRHLQTLNRAPEGTWGWHMESVANLIRLASASKASGDFAGAQQAAQQALEHLASAETLADDHPSKLTNIEELRGFLQERFIGSTGDAAEHYRRAIRHADRTRSALRDSATRPGISPAETDSLADTVGQTAATRLRLIGQHSANEAQK